jgi:probable HAF family extracellular repeat protein
LEALEDRFLLSTYTLTVLGSGIAYGINDSGLVVGGGVRAFTWDSTHGMQDLETLGVDGLSDAFAVSPAGLIVGDAPAPIFGNPRHAFLNDHGTVTDLGTFGGPLSAARGVNDAGQVVGWAETDDPYEDEHAFLWDGPNGLQDLGTLGGLASTAWAINSSGLVVGHSFDGPRAFVWDSVSGMHEIGGGIRSGAYGVNDAGQVVGGQVVSSSIGDAFLYDGGTLTDLGNLGHGVAGALAINDAGVIVGGATARDSWSGHGFVYADGVMTDLNDLVPPDSGLTIRQANGINNAGQIVGQAQDRFSHNYAILLTPDDGGAARGVAPGIVEVLTSVHESTGGVVTIAPPSKAVPERAAATTVAPQAGEASLRQATDAVFTRSHLPHAVGPAIEGESAGLTLDWSLLL